MRTYNRFKYDEANLNDLIAHLDEAEKELAIKDAYCIFREGHDTGTYHFSANDGEIEDEFERVTSLKGVEAEDLDIDEFTRAANDTGIVLITGSKWFEESQKKPQENNGQ